MSSDADGRILVPIGESATLRNTVAYAARQAQEAAEAGETASVHFVYPVVWRAVEPTREAKYADANQLLERVTIWARDDLGLDEEPSAAVQSIDIESAVLGADEYLFSPADYARVLTDYAREHDLDRIIMDPRYDPGGTAPMLRPLEFELSNAGFAVEEAPSERAARRPRLVTRGGAVRFASIFGVSYLFYLLLGGFSGGLDLATGAVSAAIVAAVLSHIVLKRTPSVTDTPARLARFVLYVPYLLWEIAKANVAIAYVVLHPRLPIDPKLVRFEAAVWGDLPVTTLANSITLTPGTLTVNVSQREFRVHSLTGSAREDLFGGALERAVRFVFYGRSAARIASPAERRVTGVIGSNTTDGTEERGSSGVVESGPSEGAEDARPSGGDDR